MGDTVITKAGLKRLSDELDDLKTRGRAAIAERLSRAAATEANSLESAD